MGIYEILGLSLVNFSSILGAVCYNGSHSMIWLGQCSTFTAEPTLPFRNIGYGWFLSAAFWAESEPVGMVEVDIAQDAVVGEWRSGFFRSWSFGGCTVICLPVFVGAEKGSGEFRVFRVFAVAVGGVVLDAF